jgi:hypothetical protein
MLARQVLYCLSHISSPTERDQLYLKECRIQTGARGQHEKWAELRATVTGSKGRKAKYACPTKPVPNCLCNAVHSSCPQQPMASSQPFLALSPFYPPVSSSIRGQVHWVHFQDQGRYHVNIWFSSQLEGTNGMENVTWPLIIIIQTSTCSSFRRCLGNIYAPEWTQAGSKPACL